MGQRNHLRNHPGHRRALGRREKRRNPVSTLKHRASGTKLRHQSSASRLPRHPILIPVTLQVRLQTQVVRGITQNHVKPPTSPKTIQNIHSKRNKISQKPRPIGSPAIGNQDGRPLPVPKKTTPSCRSSHSAIHKPSRAGLSTRLHSHSTSTRQKPMIVPGKACAEMNAQTGTIGPTNSAPQ